MKPDFHILLVEDSAADVKIIERALREAKVPHRMTVLRDGRHALDFLDSAIRDDPEAPEPPDLILLDLNLPGLDGLQVLSRIKEHPAFKIIPVVVLTTSGREQDVLSTYRAGANTFIQKPGEYPKYRDLVQVLRLYWHQTALGPPRAGLQAADGRKSS